MTVVFPCWLFVRALEHREEVLQDPTGVLASQDFELAVVQKYRSTLGADFDLHAAEGHGIHLAPAASAAVPVKVLEFLDLLGSFFGVHRSFELGGLLAV